MIKQSTHHARSALLGAVLALLLAGLAVPAAAHNSLRSSSPGDGDELDAAPEQIELRFDDDVLDLGTEIRLTGPSGEVDAGPATVSGEVVTAAVPPDLPGGQYTVEWRATSADGHPISGSLVFGIVAAAAPQPAAEPTAGEPTPAEPTAAPPAPEGVPEPSPTDLGEVLTGGDGGSRVWLFVIPAAVLAGLAVLVGRWRRGPS